MPTPQHTPTPWSKTGAYTIEDPRTGNTIATFMKEEDRDATVKAVNNHDEGAQLIRSLLKALPYGYEALDLKARHFLSELDKE